LIEEKGKQSWREVSAFIGRRMLEPKMNIRFGPVVLTGRDWPHYSTSMSYVMMMSEVEGMSTKSGG
jgi:hypothetical protein